MPVKKFPNFSLLTLIAAIAALIFSLFYPKTPIHGYGFIDYTGKIVIPTIYEEADYFSEGLAAVTFEREQGYGFIDKKGRMVIPPRFFNASSFSEGLASIRIKSAVGFIDKQGTIVIPPQFENVGTFHDGLATATLFGKNETGFINKKGEMVIPPIYDNKDNFMRFSEGLAAVIAPNGRSQFSVGYIDRSGNLKIYYDFVYGHEFKYGYAEVSIRLPDGGLAEGYKACINKSGKTVPNKFCDGRIKRLYDPKGEISLYSRNYDFVEAYGQLEPVQDEKTGKYGYKDENNKLIIPYQFDRASSFSEGLAAVYK
jgi:WG containing repeat